MSKAIEPRRIDTGSDLDDLLDLNADYIRSVQNVGCPPLPGDPGR